VYYTTSCNTQSSALEDGRDHRPKHVELIGIEGSVSSSRLPAGNIVGALYHKLQHIV